MSDEPARTLEYTRGNMQFTWVEGANFIEMYELVDGNPAKRTGFVELTIEGETVQFEDASFQEHCQRFLSAAADARIIDATGRYDIQRILGGNLLYSMESLDHHTTVGVVGMVRGEIPTSLETGGDDDEEWKLHIGGEHWVIVKKVS